MANQSRIWTDVDYATDGKQIGALFLPYSTTRSAYGHIRIPIAVIRNGDGPTAFLMAGNHGDEYEGQVALCKLLRKLQPQDIRGRVIILPAANFPAAMAGSRLSPVDDQNLNRWFPGDANGPPTGQIAHYIDSVLMPMADLHQDLHSGGSSLQYVPFASIHTSRDAALNEKALRALKAFGAPIGVIWNEMLDGGFSAVSAFRSSVVALGGEFGGSGTVSTPALRIVERGIINLLVHAGILPESAALSFSPQTRVMWVRDRSYYVYVDEAGLFEPFVELGDVVEADQPCGQVHFIDQIAREPVVCRFKIAGMVLCKRHLGRVEPGDCVAHLATDYPG